MSPHYVGSVVLTVVLVLMQSGIVCGGDDSAEIKAARTFLGTDARWTRIFTFDDDVQAEVGTKVKSGKVISRVLGAKFKPMPYLLFEPVNYNGSGVVWIDGRGLSQLCESGRISDDVKPGPAIGMLLEKQFALTALELPSTPAFRAGESQAADSLLAVRVRATLAAIATALPFVYQVDIVGTGDAGPAVLLASAFLNDLKPEERKKIRYVIADLQGATVETTTREGDPLFLPGAAEYGGIPGIAALNGTQKMIVAGTMNTPAAELEVLKKAYDAAGNSKALKLIEESLSDELILDLVTAKE